MRTIGIDIGGTSVKGGLFAGGKILVRAEAPTPKAGRDALLGAVTGVIERLGRADRIGIATAGNVDPASGTVVYATENLPGWTGTPLSKLIGERFRLPCLVENDAVAALIGELTLMPQARDVTMLTLGTGVGGASLVGGQIVRGAAFSGGRWGHVTLDFRGRKCNCGGRGCAEQYVSGTGLLRTARVYGIDVTDGRVIFARAAEGDGAAVKTLDSFFAALNALIDTVRTSLAPERIIIGGGVSASLPPYQKRLIGYGRDVVFAQTGVDAGLIGAAALFDFAARSENV